MGYDYYKGYTKMDAAVKAAADWQTPRIVTLTLGVKLNGNTLWLLRSTSEKGTGKSPLVWIECVLLDYAPGYGWGFKRLCEESHPFYYDCPIEWLKIAPCACADWRKGVTQNYANTVLQ